MNDNSARRLCFSERVTCAACVLATVFRRTRIDFQWTNAHHVRQWVSWICRDIMLVSVPCDLRTKVRIYLAIDPRKFTPKFRTSRLDLMSFYVI